MIDIVLLNKQRHYLMKGEFYAVFFVLTIRARHDRWMFNQNKWRWLFMPL